MPLTRLYKFFGIAIVSFMLASCETANTHAPVYNGLFKTSDDIYIVKPGDTLYLISWNIGVDYRTIIKLNNLVPPYHVQAGQKLLLNSAKIKIPSIISTRREKRVALAYKNKPPKPIKYKESNNHYAPQIVHTSAMINWTWPTKGKVLNNFSASLGKKGINIAGYSGAPVYAAASGIVVYTGSGLRGYGNMIIIKHNADYLSAYANNHKVLVLEGQQVKSGQKIAEIGHIGSRGNILHFEIRKAGEPVDPLLYLPKR